MKDKGFTLIELLAVIVILGIVVAIAIPGINSVISNSRKKSVLAETELLHSAAIRKLAEEPNFDFSIINKDNVKHYMETNGKDYDDLYISRVGDKLTVGLKKYGFRGKSDGKENTVTNLPPHIAYEFDFSYGQGFINIKSSDLISQELYVYEGTYESNKGNIEKGFKNPFKIITDVSVNTDSRTLIAYSGIYTVIATKMSSTEYKAENHADTIRHNFALINIPHFDIKELQVESIAQMFYGAKNFNSNINDWDVSSIKNMRGLFFMASNYNQPLNKWDTRSLINARSIFNRASNFNQNINTWNISNVTTANRIFYQALNFNEPLNNWDVSKIEDMENMFHTARTFNQDISNWNTESVSNMIYMFAGASVFNQNLSNWNVTNIQTKPLEFDVGTIAWTLPKPIWGTNGGN